MRKSYTAFKIRRSIRLPGYNYQQDGIYFITLCAYQNATFFGTICGGEMALGAMGEIVRKEWQRIPTIRKQIKLDHFAILPNHFHGLVIIDNSQVKDLAECMPGQPGKESHTLRSGSLGAVVGQFKLAVRRQAIRRGLHPPQSIWQRNYYEHIVRDEESLNEIRRYIIANPTRWHEDSLYVEYATRQVGRFTESPLQHFVVRDSQQHGRHKCRPYSVRLRWIGSNAGDTGVAPTAFICSGFAAMRAIYSVAGAAFDRGGFVAMRLQEILPPMHWGRVDTDPSGEN